MGNYNEKVKWVNMMLVVGLSISKLRKKFFKRNSWYNIVLYYNK